MEICAFIVGLVVMIACSVYQGYVFAILWGWFIIPLGVVPITTAQAIGLMLLIKWATTRNKPKEASKDWKGDMVKMITQSLVETSCIWGIAKIITFFL